MLAAALIVFREVFEAALIISIVLAATRGVRGRGLWIGGGAGGGVLAAGLVAAFAGAIAQAVSGMGQELLNATVLLVAVAMLGWHNVWMGRHARDLAADFQRVGREVAQGARPLYALAIAAGMATMREGSEVVLFLWGISAGTSGQAAAMTVGGALGLAGGVAVGLLLYLGLMRIPQRHIFSVTSWMILLLAAGMASQGAGFLVQAGWLPPLGAPVWDTSFVLADGTVLGRALKALVGYTARPDGMQLLFYLATLVGIAVLMRTLGRIRPPPAPVVAAALVLGAGVVGMGGPVHSADFKVFYPVVVRHEAELELRGIQAAGGGLGEETFKRYNAELGYGVTDWWFTELEFEYGNDAGPAIAHQATASENVFALAPQGTYPVDLGWFAELEFPAAPSAPAEWFAGPLFQTQTGALLHTLNVIFHGEHGSDASPIIDLQYSWQTKWLLSYAFSPGIEIFGAAGDAGNFLPPSQQQLLAGPVLFGKVFLGRTTSLAYNAGVLYGLSDASPAHTVKGTLEIEHVF